MIPTLKPPRRTILVVEDALTSRCILEQFFARAVVVLAGVTEVDQAEDEIVRRHGAHLLYKRFGYREVVERLEKIIAVEAA